MLVFLNTSQGKKSDYPSLLHDIENIFKKTHLIMELPPHKMIVIAGPTASGKSDLAIELAHRLNGEIISVDSRQVYRGMDIGTGKVLRDSESAADDEYISGGIRHHLIDIAEPNEAYNISGFLQDADHALTDIRARGKRPLVCGGTHFWIQALLEGTSFPAVPPDPVLRDHLSTKTTDELYTLLKAQDPTRAATIDRQNPLRLIRALEIVAALGTVPLITRHEPSTAENHSTILVLNPPKEVLRERIRTRLLNRFASGMVEEVERLHGQGIDWERLESFGLEYRFIAEFLQGKRDETSLQADLEHAIWHYARRQLSWLRRWERQGTALTWISDPKEAMNLPL